MVTRGYGSPEVVQAYSRARELCQQVGETPELFPVLWGLSLCYLGKAEHATSRELGEQCLSLAQNLNDPALLLAAHVMLGTSLFYLGALSQARTQLQQALSLYGPQQAQDLALRYGNIDLGVVGLAYTGLTLWILGYPDQALTRGKESLALAQDLAHPYTLARGFYWNTVLHQFRREWQVVHELTGMILPVAAELGAAIMSALGSVMRGWALTMQGQSTEGMMQMRQGLEAYRANAEFQRPHLLSMLAVVYGMVGHPEEALPLLTEALALVEKTGERYYEAELYRLKGELLQQADTDRKQEEAEACFQQALAIARRQEAKSWELRTAMSLARLWQAQGKRQEAHDLLAPVYGWFTEGFDTADLNEAKSLLEALA
jgi:predicted ATPase